MAASYPGAVKTFTTKSANDTIQPADVNDLQDEVNAIEAGLLNGTARLNSSGSTLASLQVSGASTLAGNVSCTAVIGSSSARVSRLWVGHLDASSGGAPAIVCRVFSTVFKELTPLNTWVGLDFQSQRVATDTAMHSTATNSSRLVAPTSGTYLVGYTIGYTGSGPNNRIQTRILQNDTNEIMRAAGILDGANASYQVGQVVWQTTAANDWFTIQARNVDSTARTIIDNPSTPEVYLVRIGG